MLVFKSAESFVLTFFFQYLFGIQLPKLELYFDMTDVHVTHPLSLFTRVFLGLGITVSIPPKNPP